MTDDSRPVLQLINKIEIQPTENLHFQLLGDFRLLRGEKSLTLAQIHLRKACDLLKLLALAPDHWLHREQLIEMLWPGQSPGCGSHNLSQTLYKLRPVLNELDPSIRLEIIDNRLRLKVEGGISTDVEDFEQAANSVLNQTSPINDKTIALCQNAIVSYSGDLLPTEGPSDLFHQRRNQLHQRYIDLLLLYADYSLELEEYLPAIETLQKVITIDPANEPAHLRLISAFALNNQRQAALRQYQSLEEKLRSELDVAPSPESQRLLEQIQNGELAPNPLPLKGLFQPKNNLPNMVSSFIGREDEISKVKELTQTNRLVMLTGTGGVGKTRLALKVAETLLDDFTHGIYWVELASLSNPEMVSKAVLDIFQLPDIQNKTENERLVNFLKDRNLLLLLDNCEHLIIGCAVLTEILLRTCPDLHILATSRTRLNLPGEITYFVPSLATPDPNYSISIPELSNYTAVRLFTERSNSFSHGFILTPANASAVANICHRLDGIPLAIELAAARTRMMTVEQITDQLNDTFRLLVGGSKTDLPRHRTLQASIEWSYAFLSRKERLLLQRLSVFAGGCGLEAVEAICMGEEILQKEVLDLLTSLVDQSLINVKTLSADEARYHLLETVRQYAQELIVKSGEATKVFQRHLTYYKQFADQANLRIRGPQQLFWLKRIEIELNNLTSAFERSLISPIDAEMGVHLACSLSWYFGMVGDFLLQRYYMLKALSKSKDFGRTPSRARVLFHVSSSSVWGGSFLEPDLEKAYLEESLGIWRELGNEHNLEEAKCLLTLGNIYKIDFNDDSGFDLMYESVNIFQNLGNTWWHAWALNVITKIKINYNNAINIRSLLKEETTLWKQIGDRWGEVLPLMYWGQFALLHNEYSEAQVYLRKSLEIFLEFGSKGMAYHVLRDLNHAARSLKEYNQAEEYLENCTNLILEIGWNHFLPEVQIARAFIALHKRDYLGAENLISDALSNALESNLTENIILCVAGFAAFNVLLENHTDAVRLFGVCYSNKEVNQYKMRMIKKKFNFDHFLKLSTTQIEKELYDQAWNAGCEMTLEYAISLIQKSFD